MSVGVKRHRYAMCGQCKEEFDITENNEKSCEHDPGDELYTTSNISI